MFIQEVVDRMTSEGFKITPRTITFYVERGLLPRPDREGGYRKGVRLAFKEEDEALVMKSLYLIFALKGKGYKLSEIKAELDRLAEEDLALKLKSNLDRYVEIDGRVYYALGHLSEHDLLSRGRLDVLLRVVGPYQYSLEDCGGLDLIIETSRRVQEFGLCCPKYLSGESLLYDEDELFGPSSWVILNLEYMIDWDVLIKLFNVSISNLRRYFYWPTPNGKTSSILSIRWMQQESENQVGIVLKNYIEWLHQGFPLGELYPFFGDLNPSFKYSNKDKFIKEFVSGKCAFVPTYPDDNVDRGELFLKRFEGQEGSKDES